MRTALSPRFSRTALARTALVLLCIAGCARAAACGHRSIDVVVPYPAGGSLDGAVRIVAEGATQATGKPFVVRNVGGGTGTIGTRQALHAAPDGCTLLAGTLNTLVLAPRSVPHAGYSFDDVTPVGLLGHTEYLLIAHPAIAADDLRGLSGAGANGGRAFSVGHPGTATVQHLALSRLARDLGIPVLPVPYRGAAPMMNDLAGGHIDLAIVAKPAAANALAAGTAKRLANVSAWMDRPADARRLPPGWAGWFVHRHTPSRQVRWLQSAFAQAMRDPAVLRRLDGIDAPAATAAEQRDFLQHYRTDMLRQVPASRH